MNVPNWTSATNAEVLGLIRADIFRQINTLNETRKVLEILEIHDKNDRKLQFTSAPCGTGFSVRVESVGMFGVDLAKRWSTRQGSDICDGLISELEQLAK